MKLLLFFKNKYVVTLGLFVLWMLFFDQNDFFTQHKRKKDLEETKHDVAFMEHQIAGMEKEYDALTSDSRYLEKYAREHYRMKRDDEDIFIIEKK